MRAVMLCACCLLVEAALLTYHWRITERLTTKMCVSLTFSDCLRQKGF
jgi:hypothetical protein